ncbi:MAG TPA: hypothetical protein VGG38_10090 [Acidimicrobiales bacterium]
MPPTEHLPAHLTAPFAPHGAVTGIGSLPTTSPIEALDFVAAFAPVLPFCPQPPAPDLLTDTLTQQLQSTELTDKWFESYVDAIASGAFPEARWLKSQLTGPITLAGLLSVGQPGDPGPEMISQLAEHVSRRATQQARVLLPFGLPVVITVDEPALALMDLENEPWVGVLLGAVFRQIRAAGALSGIHCCATAHPGRLGSLDCDVISFDAGEGIAPTEEDGSVLSDAGRIMAFGLIGTSSVPDSPGAAFSRWLTASSTVTDPVALAARTLLTPRCGLGRSSQVEAEATFTAAAAVGDLVGQMAASI